MENAGAHLGLPSTVTLGGTTSLSATLLGTPQCSQGRLSHVGVDGGDPSGVLLGPVHVCDDGRRPLAAASTAGDE
eukprot:6529866-Alexandrium_andersonii.AAC.1